MFEDIFLGEGTHRTKWAKTSLLRLKRGRTTKMEVEIERVAGKRPYAMPYVNSALSVTTACWAVKRSRTRLGPATAAAPAGSPSIRRFPGRVI